jgi:hypothetical protein
MDFLCIFYYSTVNCPCCKCEGVPDATCSKGSSNFQHTITVTRTYGCTLQFVLLMMGANSTRNMYSKYSEIQNTLKIRVHLVGLAIEYIYWMIQFVRRCNTPCLGYKHNKLVNYVMELIVVYYENDTKHINAFCRQKITFLTSQLVIHNVAIRFS